MIILGLALLVTASLISPLASVVNEAAGGVLQLLPVRTCPAKTIIDMKSTGGNGFAISSSYLYHPYNYGG